MLKLLTIYILSNITLSQIQNDLQQCNIELMSISSNNKSLKAQNESLNQELNSSNRKNAEMRYIQSQLVAMKAQISSMEENTLKLTKENVLLRQQNSLQGQDLEILKKQNKMIPVLQDKNQKLVINVNELNQIVKKVPQLQKIIEQLTHNNKEYQTEIDKTTESFRRTKDQNRELLSEIDQLTKELNLSKQNTVREQKEKVQLITKLEELQNLILQYQERIQKLSEMISELKADNERIPLFQKKLDELFNANDQYSKVLQEHKGIIDNLKLQLKETTTVSEDSIKTLEQQLEEVYLKNTKMASEISNLTTNFKQIRRENDILKEFENQALGKAELSKVEMENSTLNKRIMLLNQSVMDLRDTKNVQRKNIGDLQDKVNSLLVRLKDAVSNPVCDCDEQ